MARENIGVILCPFTKRLAVVRADCRGKKYYYSQAGKIAPNLAAGQRWLTDNMRPLSDFAITETAAGYPPEVEPLTQAPAQGQDKKPLTAKPDSAPPETPPKRRSFLDEFLG